MESKQEKTTHRGPYKRYLQDADLPIPKQTLSRWRKAADVPLVHECTQEYGDVVSQSLSYSEVAGSLDEDGCGPGDIRDDDSVCQDHIPDDDVFYDALPPDPNEPDEFLYEGAHITRCQSSTLIMAFVIRHHLSGSAVQDLLNLMNEHLPSPSIPGSNYLLRKYCMPNMNDDDMVYHIYCGNCSSYMGCSEELTCDTCGTALMKSDAIKSGNFFVSLSLKSQIRNLLQESSVYSKLKLGVNDDGNSFQDICDGNLYRETVTAGDISLSFNSDGISAFQSTSGSVWPILCTLNELPPKDRQKHVMLAGLWFGSGKPNMQVFLTAFVSECEALADAGLDWQNPITHEIVNTKVFAISCSCDSVARCQLQGLVQFNGYFGCNWCLHPTERFEGVKHIYPSHDPPHELRTHRGFVADAIRARQTGQKQNGVKTDPSPLLLLSKFNIVSGFPVDYMHAVCEGVVDRLVSLWFDSSYYQDPWYIGRRVPEINERIQGIVPPSEITRLPASPSKRAFWKASEFRCWLLFYILPILNGILPTVYLKHVSLLAQSIWLLTKAKVNAVDVETANSLLKRFVSNVGRLYGDQHMTYNNHILLHLPDTVSNWGPLWTSSCFLFEGYNRKIKSLFHGTRGVAHQIVNNFVIAQELGNRLSMMGAETPPSIVDTLKTLLRGYPLLCSVTKVEEENVNVLLQGKGYTFQCNADVEQCLTNYFGEPLCNLHILEYPKASESGIRYERRKPRRTSRRADDVVAFGPREIGQIQHILHVEQHDMVHVVLVLQPFLVTSNNIAVDNEFRVGHILVVQEAPILPPIVLPISSNYTKCVQITVDDTRYCCMLPNMVELD